MMQSTKGALFFAVPVMIAAMPADTVAAQPTKMMQGACFLNTTGSTQFYRAKWTNENWFNVSLRSGRRWCHWRPVGYKQLTVERDGKKQAVPLGRARCESIGRCSKLIAFTQNLVRRPSARATSLTARANSGPHAQSRVPRTGRTVSRSRNKFWGVAFFNCGDHGNIRSIALRGHYTKAQGEGRASYQFVWDAARAQLKARPGLLSRHCGTSRITATYVSVEETQNQAHASMAKFLGACRKQSFVRSCTDVSPLTGAYFGVLSTATRVGSSGGELSGPGVCYQGWILICSSPEVHTFNFLYQVEYRAADFKQKKCGEYLDRHGRRNTAAFSWFFKFQKAQLEKRIKQKYGHIAGRCRKPLQFFSHSAAQKPNRAAVMDFFKPRLKNCDRLKTQRCFVEQRVVMTRQ